VIKIRNLSFTAYWQRQCIAVLLAVACLSILGCLPNKALSSSIDESPATRWNAWRTERLLGPTAKAFPRFAWAYFGYSNINSTLTDFELYAKAGFTDVQSKAEAPLISSATKTGLGLILGTWEQATTNKGKLDQLIELARKESGVKMLLIQDEANRPLFARLGAINNLIFTKTDSRVLPLQTVLPAHASTSRDPTRFDPLLPCVAKFSYCNYIDDVIRQARPSALLVTDYPIWEGGEDRPGYYEELEQLRTHTQAAKIGLFGFILVTPHQDGWANRRFRRPDRSDLHWQAYTLLAYNAKGIAYYNYRPQLPGPKPSALSMKHQFGDGIVTTKEGTPTSSYPLVRELNCELQAIGPLLMRLETSQIYHKENGIATPPTSTLPSTVASIEGDDVLLSAMDAGRGKSPHLLLVNTRHGANASTNRITLKLSAGYTATQLSPGSDCDLRRERLSEAKTGIVFEIAAGNGILIELDDSRKP
jgi:hypothetical protein